ncbi:MAG: ParA family protein [Rhodomicrobium sp.]
MKAVALGMQKGGVSKSTVAIHLACAAERAGHSAALIDMDAEQGTAMNWGKRRKDRPGGPRVMASDVRSLASDLVQLGAESVEWCFLDLPGRNAPAANAGLSAAGFVLVPLRPLDVDLEASIDTIRAIKRAGKRYAYQLSICPPQVNASRARKFAEELRKAGHPVSPIIIIQRIAVPDAVAQGLCVCEAEPAGASAAEFADLFQWLKNELEVKP